MRQYGTTDVAHFIRLRVVIRQEPDRGKRSGSLFLSKRFGLADTAAVCCGFETQGKV